MARCRRYRPGGSSALPHHTGQPGGIRQAHVAESHHTKPHVGTSDASRPSTSRPSASQPSTSTSTSTTNASQPDAGQPNGTGSTNARGQRRRPNLRDQAASGRFAAASNQRRPTAKLMPSDW